MFEREHELLEYVAGFFPNQPHIQEQLRQIASRLKLAVEAPQGLLAQAAADFHSESNSGLVANFQHGSEVPSDK